MEGLIILVLAFLLTPIILSIISLIRTSGIREDIDYMKRRLADLEDRLLKLLSAKPPAERQTRERPPSFPDEFITPSPLPEPVVPLSEPIKPPPILGRAMRLPGAPSVEVPLEPAEKPPPPIESTAPPPEPPPLVPPSPPQPAWSWESIGWEKFMGVKLFAWVGGLALFLAVAFFVKHAFDNNLIPPSVRIAMGFLVGLGLIIGGLKLSLDKSPVTVQTLCATGVVILYADFFAAHRPYELIPSDAATFFLMILVTVTAFLLAVRLDAQVVAMLGLLGGFLTPVLLSTGKDNPAGLFGYLAILDIGLAAVALRKRWSHQVLLGAVATLAMQAAWVGRFFVAAPNEKILIALVVFLGFAWLFTAVLMIAHRLSRAAPETEAAAFLSIASAFVFVLYLLWHPYREIALRPGLVFGFVFLVDLAPLVICWFRDHLRKLQIGVGSMVFFLLTTWTLQFLSDDLLNWALGLYLFFAVVHSVYPIITWRTKSLTETYGWVHLFPMIALVLMAIPVLKFGAELSWLLWPALLLVNFLVMAVAVLLGTVAPIVTAVLLTMVNLALWIGRMPEEITRLPELLVVIGGFAVVFFVAGLFTSRRILDRLQALGKNVEASKSGLALNLSDSKTELAVQVPMFSAILPFFLLMLVVIRLQLTNPSPVFGLAGLLVVLLLGLVRFYAVDFLAVIGFLCVLALEHLWHERYFSPQYAWTPMLWYLGFYALFTLFPFWFTGRFQARVIPWVVSALAGPVHFYLLYNLLTRAYPNPYPGLIPAVLSLPALAGLVWLIQRIPSDSPKRNTLLALFGGSALFFITLVFPIQFDRQWITLGWALEGVALLWLFHRIPHPGLRLVGVGLLIVAFARLALNQAVVTYYERSGRLILNWFLYAYGITALCQMAGARLLAPPRNKIGEVNVPPLLYALGTILAFLLVNIEIADAFSAGSFVTFRFSGNLAQDMTYSLAWTLFAFILFIIGIVKNITPARFAGLALLTVTLLKIFLHDLWRLGGMYRIGSLVGLAVVLILVSFIYQRFLGRTSEGPPKAESKSSEPPQP
jgi:hypothetical protein